MHTHHSDTCWHVDTSTAGNSIDSTEQANRIGRSSQSEYRKIAPPTLPFLLLDGRHVILHLHFFSTFSVYLESRQTFVIFTSLYQFICDLGTLEFYHNKLHLFGAYGAGVAANSGRSAKDNPAKTDRTLN